MSLLVRTTHYSYCPYKGDCTYYSIPIGGSKSEYAVWTYENPYEAVVDIKEHLAFYPSRVDAIEVISLRTFVHCSATAWSLLLNNVSNAFRTRAGFGSFDSAMFCS